MVAVTISQQATAQARAYVSAQLPGVGRLLSCMLPGGPGQQSVAGGEHGAALAEQLSNHLWYFKLDFAHFLTAAAESISAGSGFPKQATCFGSDGDERPYF